MPISFIHGHLFWRQSPFWPRSFFWPRSIFFDCAHYFWPRSFFFWPLVYFLTAFVGRSNKTGNFDDYSLILIESWLFDNLLCNVYIFVQLSKIFGLQKRWCWCFIAVNRCAKATGTQIYNARYMKRLWLIFFEVSSIREASESQCSRTL